MLVLVDGSHMASRARFGSDAALTRSDGRASGVIYLFLRSLNYAMSSLCVDASQVAVCWDGGRSPYRMQLYPEYKKRPDPPPEQAMEEAKSKREYRDQVDVLHLDFLPSLGIRSLRFENCEADDLIGFLSYTNAEVFRNPTTIFSDDKDFHQLVSSNVIWCNSDLKKYGVSEVREHWGVLPKDIPLLRAMIGDPSDNIRGIDGIGPKKALQVFPYLYVEHGAVKVVDLTTLDSMGLPEPTKGVRTLLTKVQEGRDILSRNLLLMTIPRSMDPNLFPITEKEFAQFSCQVERNGLKFTSLCRQWEFDTDARFLSTL